MEKQDAIGFIGATRITGFIPGTTQGATDQFDQLFGAEFDVPSWGSTSCVTKHATVKKLPAVAEVIALEIGGSKIKCGGDQMFAIVNYRSYDVSEGRVFLEGHSNLAFKRARDLRSGDMIFSPGAKERDKISGLTFCRISKHRIQQLKDPVDMFTLSVQRGSTFLLPGNIITASWKQHD